MAGTKKKLVPQKNGQPGKFYAVAAGKIPGIFTEWTRANNTSIMGCSGSKHSAFLTLEEAVKYLNDSGTPHAQINFHHQADAEGDKTYSLQEFCAFIKCSVPPETIPEAEVQLSATAPVIYADGACSDNGQPDAQGGIGIYWGADHEKNVSCRIPMDGDRPTNNRAELWAVIAALQQVHSTDTAECTICTDSNYVIQSSQVESQGTTGTK